MKVTAKVKMLSIFTALVLVLALVPVGEAQANQAGDVKVLGFVPNSWDASVSKVDLVTLEEIARYYTAPRDGVDVRSWRTNRMAMDAEGNAWVLNTGTDAFRFGPGAGLQGQLVRIQGDTRALTSTQQYEGPSLAFGDDDAVQVFDIGAVDDMPRAIVVDDNGDIWVGFYGSGELHQYRYDEATRSLEPVAIFTPEQQIAFYDLQLAPNGDLFISSRRSTPTFNADFGIYRFSDGEFFLEQAINSPYALLAAPDGTVFATAYNNVLRIRDAGTGIWSQVTIPDAQNLRGMQLDGLEEENLWIADTTAASGGNRVFWYELSSGTSGFVTLEQGDTPVGVGREPSGLMWVIARTDGSTNNNTPLDQRINGFIESIDPRTKEVVGFIEVGPRPYAYGDFFVETPPVELCFSGSETAWAYGGEVAQPNWDFVRGNNWGWTNGPLSEGGYVFDIYAGAGRNDIARGTLVGTLFVDYADGDVTVTYQMNSGSFLAETHLWVGNTVLPEVRRGRRTEFTNAPGQFPNGQGFGFDPEDLSDAENVWEWSGSGFEGDIFVAAHSVVWTGVECEE